MQAETLALLPISIPVALLLSALQTTFLLGVTIFLGLFLGRKVGLGAPLLLGWIEGRSIKNELKQAYPLAIKLGVLAGVLIIGFDYLLSFFMEPIASVNAPIWQGLLASFYGGVVEEILLRLFLVTLIIWLIGKIFGNRSGNPSYISFWISILVAAIIFGLGHLPATSALTAITPLVVFRAVLLNGIGGVIFGWLYWKKGLESAMMAHFTADIILLVVFPVLLLLL